MSVATSTAIALAVTAASAGATVYAANKSSGAAENAAKTQAGAATTSAKFQTDAANHAADLQAKSAGDALNFSRQQSQLSLDQYNQQQQRVQPYRNLGNFALGLPNDAAPTPLQLPGTTTAAPQQSGQSTTGQPALSGQPVTSAATPTTSGPANGDYRSWFNNLTGWKPLDQAGLLALKPQLDAAGVKITPASAAGVISKIGLPDGSWVRVLDGDTSQKNPTVWMQQPGGGGTPTAARQLVAQPGLKAMNAIQPFAPTTPALQAPQFGYRPLGSIGTGY